MANGYNHPKTRHITRLLTLVGIIALSAGVTSGAPIVVFAGVCGIVGGLLLGTANVLD